MQSWERRVRTHLVWRNGPLRGLEGVPGLPGAPQDEAGLTSPPVTREPGRAPPRHAHGDLTSLAPHERLRRAVCGTRANGILDFPGATQEAP